MSEDGAESHWTAGERRLRALLDCAGDTIWTAGTDGIVSSSTIGLAARMGLQEADIVGRSAFDFVHPDDLPAFVAAWERLVAGLSAKEVLECRARQHDGSWRWVREILTDLRHIPEVGAICGIAVDITEQVEQTAEQRRQERVFRTRFEQSAVPQADIDATGKLSSANAALCALLGLSSEEVIGRGLRELAHDRDNGSADRALLELLSGDRQTAQVELVAREAGGRPLPVLCDMSLLRNEQGQPESVAVFWQDISVLRDMEERWDRQEELMLTMSLHTSDLSLIGDADGRLVWVSPAIRHLLGYDPQDMVERRGREFIHPDDAAAVHSAYAGVVADGGTVSFSLRVKSADGSWRWIEETCTNLLNSPVGGIACNLRDVTDQRRAEQALQASEARYRAIADTASEGILATTPTGQVLYANQRLADIAGLDLQEVYQGTLGEVLDPVTAAEVRERAASRHFNGPERYEVSYTHPDGGVRTLSVAASPLRDGQGRVEGSLSMVSDVTEARRDQEELRHAALHDVLTGLPNRALLRDRLEHALERGPGPTAVILIDLDHFKMVNDSRGHDVGDDLLVAVAARLRGAVPPAATVARLGGDEFVVLCEDVDPHQAKAMADAVLDALIAPIELQEAFVHVGASVGVAVSPPDSATDLLRFADTAMYAAKGSGRGRVRLFDRALAEEAEQRYELAADLRSALDQDQLTLSYQPVVSLQTGAVVGFEALARWQHPQRGPVPPERFVALAELSGLAQDLDAWVLHRALAEAGRLHAAGSVPEGAYVAVNLSAKNLGSPELEALVVEATRSSTLLPGQIVLEITENVLMNDARTAVSVMERLRAHGFGIAVDDFGTGYSSLAYLRDLPVTLLKVDRSFVGGITTDRDALAIVASVVNLAHAIGVSVIAEGVETAEHADLLRDLGCQAGQGWLWCPATPPDDVAAAGWTTPFPLPARASKRLFPADPSSPVPTAEHGRERLMELHLSGASLLTIAAALRLEGYRRPTGQRWHPSSIAREIARSAYPELSGDA